MSKNATAPLISNGHPSSLSLSNGLLTLWLEIMSIIRTPFIYLEICRSAVFSPDVKAIGTPSPLTITLNYFIYLFIYFI